MLVPLALLSAAWTASLAGVGGVPTPVAASDDTTDVLPNGVPEQAIEAPAPVTTRDEVSRGFTGTQDEIDQIVQTSSTNGIPSAALSAYQRAETVIDNADKSCNLTWQLIAAIGRVESNHGRFGGSALNSQGVATPAIRGPVLDGSGSTSVVRDTDAGLLDGSKSFDRAVGPMQFIPSTWSVVGVDADNDGDRNPQDIDDAALATAVYLCSGKDDLSATSGQKSAVYRYNHSDSYVSLVLRIMDAYLQGDYTAVPNGTTDAGVITQTAPAPLQNGNPNDQAAGGQQTQLDESDPGTTTDEPADEPSEEPSEEPSDDTTGGNDDGGNNGSNDNGGNDNGTPTVKPPHVHVPKPPHTGNQPVDHVLTLAQAIVQCGLDGYVDNPLKSNDAFDQCVDDYTSKG